MDKRLRIDGGNTNSYEIINFLKGFAIITIVLMHLIQTYVHAPNLINKIVTIGGSGVHVFLFCSGFGLFFSYLKYPVGYKEFLVAKLIKIYIPYIMIVLISACIPIMFSGDRFKALLSHIFLYKMFIPKYESSFGSQLWYISTLFQFYILFVPMCVIKKRLSNKSFFICALMASIIWWIIMAITGLYDERVWCSFFLQYIWEFALGMIVADVLYGGMKIEISNYMLAIISVIGIGVAALLVVKGGFLKAFNDIFAMAGYMSISLLLYSFSVKWINTVVLFISRISYELYLVHILVFTLVFNTLNSIVKNEMILGIISLMIAILIAYGYRFFVGYIRKRIKITEKSQ